MQKRFRCAILVTSLMALVGCSSLRVVMDAGAISKADAPKAGEANPRLAPGDLLTLTTRDGRQQTLHLTAVSETSLTGVADGASATAVIPLGEVTKIERREFSGIKTAFLVFAIAAGVYAVAAAVAQNALAAGI